MSEEEDKKRGVRLLLDSAMSFQQRLPMLEIVYDRFVRLFSTNLRAYTSGTVEVEVEKLDYMRFQDYIDSLSAVMLAIFKPVEWGNFGLISMDNSLIYSLVEILFGGMKSEMMDEEDVNQRTYTTIESGIIRSLVDMVLKDISSAFDPVTPTTFQLDRLESNPKFATIVRPDDILNVLSLKIAIGERHGRMEFVLPCTTYEPVKKILRQSFIGNQGGKDPTWLRHWKHEILESIVNLEVLLDGKAMGLKSVLELKVGDVIVLDKLANEDLKILVNKKLVSTGKLGKLGDKVAINFSDVVNVLGE